jgi:hypothetical protein
MSEAKTGAVVPETSDEALDYALDAMTQALVEHLDQYGRYVGDWGLTITLNDGWDEDQTESRSVELSYRSGYGEAP